MRRTSFGRSLPVHGSFPCSALCMMTTLVYQFRNASCFLSVPVALRCSHHSGLSRPKANLFTTLAMTRPKYPEGSLEASVVDQLFNSLQISDAERKRIASLPQGSKQWLNVRRNRLTASNFGAAVGRNKFMSPEKLAQEMINSTFTGNHATKWGNEHEPIAVQQYLERKTRKFGDQFTVSHSGLHISEQRPALAGSPDGHVHEGDSRGLLEVKCPYSKRQYPNGVPEYYYDQIQGLMAILGYEWTDFVVWTPTSMQVERVPFDRAYWEQDLLPGLDAFYQDIFVPAYVDFHVNQRSSDGDTGGDQQQNRAQVISLASTPEVVPQTPAAIPSPIATPPTAPAPQQAPLPPPPPSPPPTATPSRNSVNVSPTFSSSSSSPTGKRHFSARPATTAQAPSPSAGADDSVDVGALAAGAAEMSAALDAAGLELELVSRNADSVLAALLRQLARSGTLEPRWEAEAARDMDAAVRKARWYVAEYMVQNGREYREGMGLGRGAFCEHVQRFVEGRAEVKGAELSAVAEAFGVTVRCWLLSGSKLHQRVFEGGAGGEVVVCTAGGFFWSTRPRVQGSDDGPRKVEEEGEAGAAAMSATPGVEASSPASAPADETKAAPAPANGVVKVEAAGPVVKGVKASGPGDSEGGESSTAAAASGPGSDSIGQTRSSTQTAFSSSYSPLFQKCVLDVEQKLRPDQANSLEGAFRICNRSLGDRKFGEHATRKNGSSVGDVAEIARAYQALLIQHSQLAKTAAPPPPPAAASGSDSSQAA